MGIALFDEKVDLSRKQISLKRQDIISAVRWPWFEDIGWKPHRFQVPMHNSRARFRASCAGTRGGKTEWAAREASAYMIAGPFRIWIVAGSYDLGYKEFRVVKDCLTHPANPFRIVTLHDNLASGNLKITLDNGADIEVRSIDKPKKSGWGEEIDLMIISEAALIDSLGGETGVWNKMLRGRLSSRSGEVIVPTTPSGEDDWLYPFFTKGLQVAEDGVVYDGATRWREYYKITDEPDPQYFSLQWPSWANPEGFMEDPVELFNTLPRRIFEEQYMGMFVRWSGSIWLNDFCFDPLINVIPAASVRVPKWWNRLEIIDPGFSGMFAWLAAVVSPEGHLYIVDEYAENRTLYDEHVYAIKERRNIFYGGASNVPNFIPVFVDPEDPQCVAELNQKGLMCQSADNNVTAGFQAGSMRFKTQTLSIFDTCSRVIRSLRNHEWMYQKDAGGKRKEKNDAYKHDSDLVRYLNLAPVWPSEMPVTVEDVETIGDMIASLSGKKDYMDLTIDEWMRSHSR